MCWKIKATVFLMLPASWETDMSSFYCFDNNFFLIDYDCCKICNIWFLLENNSSSITMQRLNTGGKTFLQLLLKIG